jgi:hypothetical protein
LQREQKLLDLYLFALDACLRDEQVHWWRYSVGLPFADLAQGVKDLKDLCLNGLLYETGDVATVSRVYELLEEEGYVQRDDDRYLLELLRFIRPLLSDGQRPTTLDRLRTLVSRRRAVVSVVIPDDAAFSNFVEFCFPSLESEGALNLFLRKRAVTFLVFACGRRLTETQDYLEKKGLDCAIVCQPICESLCSVARIGPGSVTRDWLLGALQYSHILTAKRLDADFHAINANAVYGSGYFKQVMRLAESRPAVLSATTWINARGEISDRVALRQEDGSFAIPASELTAISLRATAPAACATFAEGYLPARGSTAHLRVTWTGEDCIEIQSTCHEIVLLARESLRKIAPRFSIRPGADVDRMLSPRVVPHFVKEDDDIAIAELGHPPGGFDDVGADPFKFDRVTSRLVRPRQAEFFKQAVRLAISHKDGRRAAGATERNQPLRRALAARLDEAGLPGAPTPGQIVTALGVLHQHEISEYGLESMATTIARGRELLEVVPTADGALDLEQRRVLTRAAMNFDHVDKAIELAAGGGNATSFIREFLLEMMALKAAIAQHARRLNTRRFGRPFAVVGSIAWGEAFVDKFLNYNLPSMLAPGNIPALARGRKVVHSIVTTESDRETIVAHPVFARLSEYAEVVFTCFSEKFIQQRQDDGYNFYYFYGLLDHQSVFLASALRAELYLWPVDVVLSSNALKNLNRHLALGADCCSIAGIECDPSDLRVWLDARPRGAAGELDLPARELLAAAIARPDAYFRSLVMDSDNKSFCRHPRELIWSAADGLAIHSIFMHPIAVSARLMSRSFHPQHENVDFGLLPRLLQGDGQLKVLRDATEAAIAQFGAPAAREEFLDGGFSLGAFVEAHRYDYAAQRRCFAARQFFPCPGPPYASSPGYDADVALIEAALKRYRFRTACGHQR